MELSSQFVFLQIVYPGRILKLRVRGTKRDLKEDTSSEEVCIVLAGVIARFDGSDIQVYTLSIQNIFHRNSFWQSFLGSACAHVVTNKLTLDQL